jgi:hypothetical protein
MKLRTILLTLSSSVMGFLLGVVVSGIVFTAISADLSVSRHWKRFNEFNARMRDPKNYQKDLGTGLYTADVPYDPEVSLAVLVDAGELEHVDIVLPLVPKSREANLYWMQFVDERRDTIVYATGNPESVALKPSGEPPLHLNLWFKEAAKRDVQQLIRELEAQFGKNT